MTATTTEILVDLARAARSCVPFARDPQRARAFEALAETARLHAERWALAHPEEWPKGEALP